MANIYDTATASATIGGLNVTIGGTVFFAENWVPSWGYDQLDIPGPDNEINGQIWNDRPQSGTLTIIVPETDTGGVNPGVEFSLNGVELDSGNKTWVITEVSQPKAVGDLWKYDITCVEKITPAALTALWS